MARCRGGRPLCGVLFRVLALCAALCSPTPAPASVGGGGRGGRPATVPSASLVCLRGGTSLSDSHGASGQPPDRDRDSRRTREHAGRGSKDAGEPRRYNLRHRHQRPSLSPSGSGRLLRPAVSPRTRRERESRHSTAAAGRDAKARGGAECQALRASALTCLPGRSAGQRADLHAATLCCAVLCAHTGQELRHGRTAAHTQRGAEAREGGNRRGQRALISCLCFTPRLPSLCLPPPALCRCSTRAPLLLPQTPVVREGA